MRLRRKLGTGADRSYPVPPPRAGPPLTKTSNLRGIKHVQMLVLVFWTGIISGGTDAPPVWCDHRTLCWPAVHRVGRLNRQIDCRGGIAYGGINMNQNFTAVVKQDGPWWIGWVEEVPGVNCQERTRDELLKTLRVTLMEALEMNRTDARDAAGKGYEELSIAV